MKVVGSSKIVIDGGEQSLPLMDNLKSSKILELQKATQNTHTLTHSLTHTLTHSYTHSHTHTHSHSLTQYGWYFYLTDNFFLGIFVY